jgi:release factor glutamine methyltransferase
MTIADWLVHTMTKLGEAGVDSPRRDALVLLEDTLGKERSWILAHADYELTEAELKNVDALISRRLKREPLAYIRGKAWFYGRFFQVNDRVLAPRPETEQIIEIIKEIKPTTIFDIGTGSGCIAVTAALELPGTNVFATDTSSEALEIAKQNAKTHQAVVGFLQTDLLKDLENFDFSNTTIAANLPYVPADYEVSPEVKQEPNAALYSGEDGLDHYQQFWQQVSVLDHKPPHILTESLESQHEIMEDLAAEAGYRLEKVETLIQHWVLQAKG